VREGNGSALVIAQHRKPGTVTPCLSAVAQMRGPIFTIALRGYEDNGSTSKGGHTSFLFFAQQRLERVSRQNELSRFSLDFSIRMPVPPRVIS
jgi:hypothetical protein